MDRMARLVVPEHPHYVTQRGNRWQKVFFSEQDYADYLTQLTFWAGRAGTEIWSYCLMPNQVHLILVPAHPDGLRAALGEAHRRYTRLVNEREGWRGHLWQQRFRSFVMDGDYLPHAARHVALAPVTAGMVRRADHWGWSSARAHLDGKDDGIVRVAPLLERIGDWPAFLRGPMDAAVSRRLETHMSTGRPLGSDAFVTALEARFHRPLRPRPPGRPRAVAVP